MRAKKYNCRINAPFENKQVIPMQRTQPNKLLLPLMFNYPLFIGTLTILDPPNCDCPPNLYRVSTTQSGLLTPDVAVEAFYSNGIQFTVDYRIMYTIDYYNRQIFSFQFDLIKGIICK